MKTISFIASLVLVATTTEAIEINAETEFFGGSDSFFGDFSFASQSLGGGFLPQILGRGGSGQLKQFIARGDPEGKGTIQSAIDSYKKEKEEKAKKRHEFEELDFENDISSDDLENTEYENDLENDADEFEFENDFEDRDF